MEQIKNNNQERAAMELEIFNSMPHETYEECIALAEAIDDFRHKCNHYDYMFESLSKEIEFHLSYYQKYQRQLINLIKFKSSKIGNLIKKYIERRERDYDCIIKEMDDTGNPFKIKIKVGKSWFEASKIEVSFNVYSTDTSYRQYGVFDIDNDINCMQREANNHYNSLQFYTKIKDEIIFEGVKTKYEYYKDYDNDDEREFWWHYDGKPLYKRNKKS